MRRIIRKIIPFLIVPSLGLVARSSATTRRNSITPQQVARALNEAGYEISPQRIKVLANAVASTRDPLLRVGAFEQWRGGQVRLRVECVNGSECVPFFVQVDRGEFSRYNEAALPQTPLNVDENAIRPVLAHAGSAARLVLTGPHSRIGLSVICLESGRAGQMIRVVTRDRRQTLLADVVGPNELEGALP